MPFDEWFMPGIGASPNKAQIRISKNTISFSRFVIENYFKHKDHARIGYDADSNRLIIMPVEKGDNYGLKVMGKDTSNFKYINARNFINNFMFQPAPERKSEKYDCLWDDQNNWIVVENAKKIKGVFIPHP